MKVKCYKTKETAEEYSIMLMAADMTASGKIIKCTEKELCIIQIILLLIKGTGYMIIFMVLDKFLTMNHYS